MHFGGCFGEFADRATIVWYVKLIPQPHAIIHNRQTPEVAMVVAYLCVYTVCVTTIDMFRVLYLWYYKRIIVTEVQRPRQRDGSCDENAWLVVRRSRTTDSQ